MKEAEQDLQRLRAERQRLEEAIVAKETAFVLSQAADPPRERDNSGAAQTEAAAAVAATAREGAEAVTGVGMDTLGR